MIISSHYGPLSGLPFDFALILLEVELNHLSLACRMLATVQHDSKVDIERVAREFVKCLVDKLEYQHVSDVEIFIFERLYAPLKLFHGCFEIAHCAGRSTHLEDRVFNVVLVFVALLEYLHHN